MVSACQKQKRHCSNFFVFVLMFAFFFRLGSFRSEPRSFASTFPAAIGIGDEGGVGMVAESENCSLYGSDEEQEDDTQYCRGGYHPVVIGNFTFGELNFWCYLK